MSCTARAEVVIVAPERVLTLDQALDIALQQNRSLENAGMEVDKAADSVKAVRTRQLPRLDLNLSESYNLKPQSYTYESGTFGLVPARDVDVDAKEDFTTIVSLSVRQPLSELYRIGLGVSGAFAALYVMNSPFGFMAFLGIVALIGVIVSHIIVLFDFVEEAHDRGEALVESLLDAGIVRLRPVLITVGATVAALIPLAIHGGPLWQPLCYAQIGGLLFATFVTLILVPVFYAVFVLDLKIVKWQQVEGAPQAQLMPTA